MLVGEVFKMMVDKAKELNLLEGVNIGHDGVNLSHLQFVTIHWCFVLIRKNAL